MLWHDATDTLLKPLVETNRLGLITDMDGTLSPIVDKPEQAHITQRSRRLLQDLQKHIALVAVVSGRAVTDVRNRVNLPHLTYLGNHGLERWVNGAVSVTPEARQYRPQLETVLAALRPRAVPGLFIEDKKATLSIHYRQTDDPAATAAALRPIVATIADEQGLRWFEGRMIFELRPPVEVNKGTALRSLVTEHHLDAAVYIGDDTTDVDALRMARQLRDSGVCYALGIGVQSPDMPDAVAASADMLASGIAGVEDFLDWLFHACKASST